MQTEIIRAFMLEPGDIFKKLGIEYKVTGIAAGKIISKQINARSNIQIIGANSQERIELICTHEQHTSAQLVINFKPFKKLNHGTDFENRIDTIN